MSESDGLRSAREYDALAASYAVHNRDSPYNAYYERPAMMALLGDVGGQRVLEVGCGSGPLTAWLVDQGAEVTAMDVSPQMVAQAGQLVGDRARLVVADVAEPLTFAEDASFDLVVASLVLHYLRDWEPVLTEFRRVLRRGGSVVFSTHHPTMDWKIHSPDDYFAFRQMTEAWAIGSRSFEVTFWRRPLTMMVEAIAAAGLVIHQLVEPAPLPELEQRDAAAYRSLCTKPQFLFFRLGRRD
jgi:SAM-dependent methyltransferase